jgi:hypothetical protein
MAIMDDRVSWNFSGGMNSSVHPLLIGETQYRMGMNVTSRGGPAQTRPGMRTVFSLTEGHIQGMTSFRPTGGSVSLVWAIGGRVYHSPEPYTHFEQIEGIQFSPRSHRVSFTACVQTTEYNNEGFLFPLERPRNILIMQDRNTRAAYWDGGEAGHLNPTLSTVFDEDGDRITQPGFDETPIGLWSAWAGNRLWVSRGNEVFASDVGNPLKFTETQYLAEGRSFVMPETVTGMIQPASGTELVVFGENTTTFLQAQIPDRNVWLDTPNFQRTEYGIGCVAPLSLVNRMGLIWWYSANGWVNFNFALQSLQDSIVRNLDDPMMDSKAHVGFYDNICAGSIENYLLVSVPSGDRWNRHTWAMDMRPEGIAWDGYWTGVQPVQWASVESEGQERIFCISMDHDGVNRLWEAFDSSRTDNGEPITCAVATRSLNFENMLLKQYRHTDFFIEEMLGTVDIYAGVVGNRGGYARILTKRMEATEGAIADNIEYGEDDLLLGNRVQTRHIISSQFGKGDGGACNECGVESERYFGHDREFSHLLIWSGRMGLSGFRMFTEVGEEKDDLRGRCEKDEEGPRSVNDHGCSGFEDVVATRPLECFEADAVHEATAPENYIGGTHTAGASACSFISQQDAQRKADGQAKLIALSLLHAQQHRTHLFETENIDGEEPVLIDSEGGESITT